MSKAIVTPAPHRRTTSLNKTKVIINVYDLLPAGTLTSLLWSTGLSLLHSGVVINTREYAYGGHDRPHLTGVYHSAPGAPPPGAHHRLEIFHGFTILTPSEIDAVVKDASKRFLGPDWNLLERNCNHFTSFLCEELTGVEAPGWLNRAARVGVRVPCLLPREVVRAPGADEGEELLEEDEESDEEAHMLGRHREGHDSFLVDDESSEEEGESRGGSQYTSDESEDERERVVVRRHGEQLRPPIVKRESQRRDEEEQARRGRSARQRPVRDTAGRTVPVSERAPAP